MEKETLEEGLLQHIKFCIECNNESQAIRLLEKYGFEKQEQDNNKSSEEGMKKAYCNGANLDYDIMISTKEGNQILQEWFENFLKKQNYE